MSKTFPFIAISIGLFVLTSCGIFSPNARQTVENSLQKAPYDAIIVPGVPHDGEAWSETMKMRVTWAKYLYDCGYVKNIIYSGSAVYSPYVEAQIMALYGEASGIPVENIFIDPRAEHSTENVYYGYQVAKKHGFTKVALATDPFQTNTLRSYIKKFELPVDLLPIIYDTLKLKDLSEPEIDASKAKIENFVSIKERESFRKRFRGTMGKNVEWKEEDLKKERLKRKYLKRK